ncbi:methyltransferase domain-containing protein [Paenibacillus sp. JDR-2]|uniref:methyltransferase domain-containing protein n=1 Tax=Paenibacillus sp. (strain JDR-2) TaxID=324057 RepID=UPI0001666C22|nr:methyltransferase domain-containing protein [Paenibacillus sp. JDR-2]ACT01239.1 Methyltransferase type 11 [Paenibacillus sp. JDR-2]
MAQLFERLDLKEWLDGDSVEPVELEKSLREVWGVNRYLGGNPALFVHLERLMRKLAPSEPVRVLDVATGLADLPVAFVDWCKKRGRSVSLVAVDNHPQIVQLATRRTDAHPSIEVLHADATALPFADRSFDLAFCNLALHHLDEQSAIKLFAEMARVTRAGWVVTDLERHRLAYLAAKLLAKFVWKSPVTRHDGPLSVMRSFTPQETRRLVELAGVNAAVHKHFPFRLAVVGHE